MNAEGPNTVTSNMYPALQNEPLKALTSWQFSFQKRTPGFPEKKTHFSLNQRHQIKWLTVEWIKLWYNRIDLAWWELGELSIGLATRPQAERSGFDSRQSQVYLIPIESKLTLYPTQRSVQYVPGREVDHLPPSSAGAEIGGAILPLPSYTFIA